MNTQELMGKLQLLERKIERLETQEFATGGTTVAARYSHDNGQSLPNATWTILDFHNKQYDTHDAVATGSAWKFIVPISGYYEVSASMFLTATSTWDEREYGILFLAVNGTREYQLDRRQGTHSSGGGSVYFTVAGTTTVYLNAGDYIHIEGYQSSGAALTLYSSNDKYTFVSINKRGSTDLPTVTEVFATWRSNTGQSIPNATWTNVNFNNQTNDSHGGGATTGSSFSYTVPVSGYYHCHAQVMFSPSTNWAEQSIIQMAMYRNGNYFGTFDRPVGQDFSAGAQYKIAHGSHSQYLYAGDIIEVMVNQQSGAALTLHNSYSYNKFEIFRVGAIGSAVSVDQSLIVARYTKSNNQNIATGTSTVIDFDTQMYDSHQAATTGWSWNYKIPVAGYYHVTCRIVFSTSTAWAENELASIDVFGGSGGTTKKGNIAYVTGLDSSGVSSQQPLGGSGTYYFQKDELLNFHAYQASGGTRILLGTTDVVWCSIEKLGPIGNQLNVTMTHDLAVGGKWLRNSDQSIPNNTTTAIDLDTEVTNSGHFSWSSTTNPDRIYFNKSGTYIIGIWPYWRNNNLGGTIRQSNLDWYDASAGAGGSLISQRLAPGVAFQRASETWIGWLDAGDYITTTVLHNHGSSIPAQMRLWIQIVSPVKYGKN